MNVAPRKLAPVMMALLPIAGLLIIAVFFRARFQGPDFVPIGFYSHYFWPQFVGNMILFYLSYQMFNRADKSVRWRISIFAVALLIVTVEIAYLFDQWHLKQLKIDLSRQLTLHLIWVNVIVKGFYMLCALITASLVTLVEQKRQYGALKLATVQAELSLLKSQTQPHFLFNTLNSLYASAYQSGDIATANGIGQMSSLLRYMLHSNQLERVALTEEIEHIENYIALQQFRFTLLSVNFSYPDELDELFIPPMLLMPLVENAFKYGVNPQLNSHIDIRLSYRQHRCYFCVKNTDHSQLIKQGQHYQNSGLGLDNLKQRLTLISAGDSSIKCSINNKQHIAELELSCH